jgi:hypothetical protein
MEIPHDMTTLSEAMNSQRAKGFTDDFSYNDGKFGAKIQNEEFLPENLTIVKIFRFEGISDPSDMEILYSIESDNGIKGLFIDAFGAYSAQDGQKLAASIKKMKITENHSKD